MNIKSPFQMAPTQIKFESFAIADISSHKESMLRVFGKKTDKSFSSFPQMSQQEMNVWKSYCPKIEGLETTTLPLHENALEIIEKTKGKKMFHMYEVWSESEEVIDPILVGVNLKKSYSDQEAGMKELLGGRRYEGQNDYFLLCRWGESLKPFEEIKKIGFKNKVGIKTLQIKQEIKRATRELEDLEDSIRQELGYYE